MKIDRLIAHSKTVSREITAPWSLGFFRHPDAPDLSEELHQLNGCEGRVVIVGAGATDQLSHQLTDLRNRNPGLKVELLLHWSEALAKPSVGWAEALDRPPTVYVAVDNRLSMEQAAIIRRHWHPRWILVPRVALQWSEHLLQGLFPNRQGELMVWAPPSRNPDGPFLSIDELEHHVQTLKIIHPLIRVRPVPPSWHVVSERGPIGPLSRFHISPHPQAPGRFDISVIVPVRSFTSETMTVLSDLHSSLCEATGNPTAYEIIVALDGIERPPSLELGDTFRFVSIPRLSNRDDWRAGYVRNIGAANSRSRPNGLLMFCDSDVRVSTRLLQTVLGLPQTADFAQIGRGGDGKLSWQTATGKVVAVRHHVFKAIGGFPEAFCQYGCEDNALSWILIKSGHRGVSLSSADVTHLRATTEDDTGLLKMHRVRSSAQLFYRMFGLAGDSSIYWHFYSCLDNSNSLAKTLIRALLKRPFAFVLVRMVAKPLVFALTLQQSENRLAVLKWTIDSFVWDLKRHVGKAKRWVQHGAITLVKEISWRVPCFFRYKVLQPALDLKHRLICSRFGWNSIGWRIAPAWAQASLFIRETCIRKSYHVVKTHAWRVPWLMAEPYWQIKGRVWYVRAFADRVAGLWRRLRATGHAEGPKT